MRIARTRGSTRPVRLSTTASRPSIRVNRAGMTRLSTSPPAPAGSSHRLPLFPRLRPLDARHRKFAHWVEEDRLANAEQGIGERLVDHVRCGRAGRKEFGQQVRRLADVPRPVLVRIAPLGRQVEGDEHVGDEPQRVLRIQPEPAIARDVVPFRVQEPSQSLIGVVLVLVVPVSGQRLVLFYPGLGVHRVGKIGVDRSQLGIVGVDGALCHESPLARAGCAVGIVPPDLRIPAKDRASVAPRPDAASMLPMALVSTAPGGVYSLRRRTYRAPDGGWGHRSAVDPPRSGATLDHVPPRSLAFLRAGGRAAAREACDAAEH